MNNPFRKPSDRYSGPWVVMHGDKRVQSEASEGRAQGAVDILNRHEKNNGRPETHYYEYFEGLK